MDISSDIGYLFSSFSSYIWEHIMPQSGCNTYNIHSRLEIYSYRSCSFLSRCDPSYNARSIAAATVSVPPITAQTPTRNDEKLLLRASRLITFMGEISYLSIKISPLSIRKTKHKIQATTAKLTYEKNTPGIPPDACNRSLWPEVLSSPPWRLRRWLVTLN